MLGGGALLAGRWPAENLRALRPFGRLMFIISSLGLMLGGGALPPRTPPAGRLKFFGRRRMLGGGGLPPPRTPPAGWPLAGGESRALRPFGRLILVIMIMTMIIINDNSSNNDYDDDNLRELFYDRNRGMRA